jgi:DNA polymerase alpha subunit A
VREEVRGLLAKAGVATHRMLPVKRSYAFEQRDIPHGPQWVLKASGGRGCGLARVT